MMNNPITGYQSLADEDYKMLAYVFSLKGLLKPFKSKGELELLESNAQSAREMMEPLMQRLNRNAQIPVAVPSATTAAVCQPAANPY